jgi:intracellular sulfur oxidation DsrE/DsrF family protein
LRSARTTPSAHVFDQGTKRLRTMECTVVLNQDQMGHGDRALGQKILATFLRKSIRLADLTSIVFFNSGVKLVAKDSPVLAELRALHDRGVDLVPCGTCLQAFGVEPAVGNVSDMETILTELDRAHKVITL